MSQNHDAGMYDSVTIKHVDGLDLIEIERPECSASLTLQGGQLISYAPHGEHPVLWRNPDVAYQKGEAVRQGIPICWPWFAFLERNADPVRNSFPIQEAPAHGVARNALWRLLSISEDETSTSIAFELSAEPLGLKAVVTYRLGAVMKMELQSFNLSDQPKHLSCALHTYFAVSDIQQVSVLDLDDLPYIDSLRGWSLHKQDGPLHITEEVDRIYYDTPAILRIHDKKWERFIVLESADSRSAVVWNPWTEKSKRLSHFSPDSYKQMLCVETGKLLNDYIELEPGQSHTLDLTLSSRR
ncbi:D-hexose-6-phosphate mutarotase [Hahella sp. HN01]|uniref:D-hexose-6-phosphate mutarotase n=1 Tax=Hahella sp. HN01 TaxID=2847262 RepID=UPI001C1F1E6C|nr:D-hexose-6-phosphate mutarotase [Hahella sp. HN01]MBU6952464.1 D-hexose-6-phosphate mutarotase [Hahella sp. HN01]